MFHLISSLATETIYFCISDNKRYIYYLNIYIVFITVFKYILTKVFSKYLKGYLIGIKKKFPPYINI